MGTVAVVRCTRRLARCPSSPSTLVALPPRPPLENRKRSEPCPPHQCGLLPPALQTQLGDRSRRGQGDSSGCSAVSQRKGGSRPRDHIKVPFSRLLDPASHIGRAVCPFGRVCTSRASNVFGQVQRGTRCGGSTRPKRGSMYSFSIPSGHGGAALSRCPFESIDSPEDLMQNPVGCIARGSQRAWVTGCGLSKATVALAVALGIGLSAREALPLVAASVRAAARVAVGHAEAIVELWIPTVVVIAIGVARLSEIA